MARQSIHRFAPHRRSRFVVLALVITLIEVMPGVTQHRYDVVRTCHDPRWTERIV